MYHELRMRGTSRRDSGFGMDLKVPDKVFDAKAATERKSSATRAPPRRLMLGDDKRLASRCIAGRKAARAWRFPLGRGLRVEYLSGSFQVHA